MLTGPGFLPSSGGKARKLVVFCHGYGSNGQDLLDLAPYWSSVLPDVEFLAPNGPETWEGGSSGYHAHRGYQWFSLQEFTPDAIQKGLHTARPHLKNYLLDALAHRNLTPADLAIVGFSQGGMMALDMMFALPGLGGIICYSGGFFPPPEDAVLKPYPKVLLVHGDADTIVPYPHFLEAQQQLNTLGVSPQTLTCSRLGHSIDEGGLKAGGSFLSDLFTQEKPVIYMNQQ